MFKSSVKIALIAGMCFMAACAPSDKKQTNTKESIPEKLGFQKPEAGTVLTQSQINEIKNTFNVKSSIMLPPGELVFPKKEMTRAEKQELAQKEQALKQADPESYNLLMEARKHCKKGHPTFKAEATFPLEEKITEADLQVGDKYEMSGSVALIGNNCPVDFYMGAGLGAHITDKDSAEKSVTGKAGANSKYTFVMKNPKYAALLGARGMIIDGSISGLAARREIVEGKSDRLLVSYKLEGSFLSLKADIPYLAEIKALGEQTTKQDAVDEATIQEEQTSSNGEAVATIKVQMPEFVAEVIVYMKTKGQEFSEHQYFVNGIEKSEKQMRELFGDSMKVAAEQSVSTANSLN